MTAVESVRRISVVWDPFTHSKVLMCAGDMPNDSEVVAASDHDAVVAALTRRVERAEAQNAELVKVLGDVVSADAVERNEFNEWVSTRAGGRYRDAIAAARAKVQP